MNTLPETLLNEIIAKALKQAGYDSVMHTGFDGLRVLLDSEGLDLQAKATIERTLITAFERSRTEGMLPLDIHPVIYFRRKNHTPPTKPAPAPKSGNAAALGVKFAKRAIPGVKNIILVASGKGGVGKSTISANLAVALAATHRVGLLDADIYGPSAQILLGLGGKMPVTSGKQLRPLEGHGVKVVSFGFLTDPTQPIIWRGPMASKALEQFFYDVDWGDLDYLIVDMPPGTGDIQMTIAERLPIGGVIIVTTPQDVALVDAHKALSMFEKLNVSILGAVENMAWFTCSHCGHEDHIFGHEAFVDFLKHHNLPLLARIPLSRELRLRCDSGNPAARAEPTSQDARSWHELASAVTKSAMSDLSKA